MLLELPKKGLSREESYSIVQENAMKIWEVLQQGAFKNADENLFLNALLNDERLKKYLSENEIKACFDYGYYTKNVGAIFKRVFE